MALFSLHPAGKARPFTSVAAVVFVSMLLSACETPIGGNFGGSGERRAEQLAQSGRYDDAASHYIHLASGAIGAERDRLTLLAVEQWLDGGDVDRAGNAFSQVVEPTSGALLPIWNTNASALALYEGKADAALEILEPLSREPLPLRDRLRVEALRADAWIQKDDPARAIELMTQRETWLDEREQIQRNRERLWQGLLYSNPQTLRQAARNTTDEQARGWLLLGSLATSTGQQGPGWANGFARWREANSAHPAITIISDIGPADQVLLDYPRQIALLLPLSDRGAAYGKAIQNGFLGAYFAASGNLDDSQTLRVYDVNAEGGPSAAYQTAVSEGAEFVVGPLLKKNVATLANDTLVPVPILTLNYLEDSALPPPGLYQFALAPEDEAAAAAVRARDEGYKRAVALVPDNAWGRKVMQSFVTEFEGLGGTMLDYRFFVPNKQDFSTEIETLMGLSGSVTRYRRMRANIGDFALQFDPRRRQDVEFIFLAADAEYGRLLKSQLKFHYSGDLPTFSTSSVNSLDGRSNADLNGIMFADVPWLINPQPWIEQLPQTFAEYWPKERKLGRLHAMGYDSYNLIAALYANRGGPMQDLDGATGTLFLDQFGRVHRRLPWAQFQSGETVALPDLNDYRGPIQDTSDDTRIISPDTADDAPWDPDER